MPSGDGLHKYMLAAEAPCLREMNYTNAGLLLLVSSNSEALYRRHASGHRPPYIQTASKKMSGPKGWPVALFTSAQAERLESWPTFGGKVRSICTSAASPGCRSPKAMCGKPNASPATTAKAAVAGQATLPSFTITTLAQAGTDL